MFGAFNPFIDAC
jgi:hypothetical protein